MFSFINGRINLSAMPMAYIMHMHALLTVSVLQSCHERTSCKHELHNGTTLYDYDGCTEINYDRFILLLASLEIA